MAPRLEIVGRGKGFFALPSVAVFELTDALHQGDRILLKGSTTELLQTVGSMQRQKQAILEGRAGDVIGVQIGGRCRRNDIVYKLVDDRAPAR